MKKISVIIPVYNVEKYIKRCVESVLNQDLSLNEYDIIVVDDETPDKSIAIVEELQINNSQIKIIRQKNKGLGGARNTGIFNASSNYLLFLDADDYLVKGGLKKILQKADESGYPDILEYSASKVDSDLVSLEEISIKDLPTSISGIDYYNSSPSSIPSACNKLYKLSFLKGNNLNFKERIYIEDFEFNTRALFFSKHVLSSAIEVVHFVQTTNSITRNNSISIKRKLINDIITVTQQIVDFEKRVSSFSLKESLFFNELKTLLTVNFIFQSLKYNIPYKEIKKNRDKLIDDDLFFLDYPIRDKKKNLFRIVMKNQFNLLKLFFLLRK